MASDNDFFLKYFWNRITCNDCKKNVDKLCPMCEQPMGKTKNFCQKHDSILLCGSKLKECHECRKKGFKIQTGTGVGDFVYYNGKKYRESEFKYSPHIANFENLGENPIVNFSWQYKHYLSDKKKGNVDYVWNQPEGLVEYFHLEE